MPNRYYSLTKFFLTLIFISLSFFFFFKGYSLLNYKLSNNIDLKNNILEIDNHLIIYNKESTILSKNIDLDYKKQKKIYDDLDVITDNEITIKNEIIVKVKKNDTFGKIISPFFQSNAIKNEIINKLNNIYNLKNLKIGQEILFYENNQNIIEKIIIPFDFSTDIVIEISNNKIFLSKQKIELYKEIEAKKILIQTSLYEDGIKSGIPLFILSESIKLFSFDVDFQRDIQKKDTLEVSYETFFNKRRMNVSYGNIKYINLSLQNNNLEYFLFQTEDGYFDYFNKEGKNNKKSLMKTPVDGAKLSSSYGMRKHPILGYNKLHKGVDFAAKKGTPIFAAGNGIIEYAGKNSSYGKYIRIRHNNSYKTAYAHLNNFGKNIHKGKRVNQGDIVGYIGSTGNSTGPHLHYEIIYLGKQINPMKLKLPSSKKLQGQELKKFNIISKNIYSEFLYSLYE